jgi:hypothetical protein
MPTLFTHILPIAICLTGVYFAFRSEMLRDVVVKPGGDYRKVPFSFARTQLLWWSLIIISCFCVYYGVKGQLVDLSANYACLVLMGISLGTTTAAKIIDNTDISQNLERHQDTHPSKGMLIDILSDEKGISVHRFQAVAFNLIFGVMFITHFMAECEFLILNDLALSLMGISSTAYIGLKLNENTKAKDQSGPGEAADTPPALSDDDLRDIDESYYLATGKVEAS